MAAAARAPGPADARIPCPLCGGLIHPIAGRCKHCKGDVSSARTARPAAAAALPPLVAPAQPAPAPPAPPAAPNPYAIAAANGHSNGHTPYAGHPAISPAQLAHAAAAYAAPEVAQPILPPRPTGRMPVAPGRATWKSWPVIVIILATIAIVTAVVLMVWPPPATAEVGAPSSTQPVPAPERMDTSPLPPSPPPSARQPTPTPSTPAPAPAPAPAPDKNDPWSGRGAAPPPDRQPAPDIDDPDLQDPLANDPFSRRGGSLGGSLGSSTSVTSAMLTHACDRLIQCGNADATIKATCDVLSRHMPRATPPSCPAAQRCFAHIDRMDCDASIGAGPAALSWMLQQFSDCTDAMSC